MASQQTNLRLSAHDRAVLEAVAFLTGSNPTEVARTVVRKYLRSREREHRVQEALKLRAAEAAEVEGRVTPLRSTGTSKHDPADL